MNRAVLYWRAASFAVAAGFVAVSSSLPISGGYRRCSCRGRIAPGDR